jgi:hypothetical protein
MSTFDESPLKSGGIIVVPRDAVVCLFEDGSVGELGAVFRDNAGRLPIDPDRGIQLRRDPCP